MKTRLVVAAIVASCPAQAALAQQPRDTVRLPLIVVTATRLPVERDAVPNAVTVLEGADLERRGITRVSEALRLVPGLAVVQSGSPGAVTSLFMRGGENDYVRVLVDGVPVNQPGGTVNLADMATDNVERIEVVRGPASALYGSDAVSGVVNVIMRRGGGPFHASATTRATEDGYVLGATAGGGAGAATYSLGASRSEMPGAYAFNSGSESWSASGQLRLSGRRGDLALTARHTDGLYRYPTDYTGQPVDSNQFTAARLTVLGLEAGRALGSQLEARLLLGITTGDERAENSPDGVNPEIYRVRTPYGRRSADFRVNYRTAGQGVVTLGAAVEAQQFRGSGQADSLGRSNRAVYAQLVGPAADSRMTFTGGVRLEDNERFGKFVTVRGGFSGRVGAGTIVRASVGTGFKEPTFYETYDTPWSTGNPDLAPERSLGGEIGLEQRLGPVALALTAFAQQFDSLIQYGIGPDGTYRYHNLAGARAGGLELEVRSQPWRGAAVSAGWTWLHTETFQSGADPMGYADGRPLLRRPLRSGTLALDQAFAAFDAGLTILYTGPREDVDFMAAERRTLPPYTRVDARLAWRPAGRVAFTAAATNVLDARYQEVLGFPARGRTIWLGARIGTR